MSAASRSAARAAAKSYTNEGKGGAVPSLPVFAHANKADLVLHSTELIGYDQRFAGCNWRPRLSQALLCGQWRRGARRILGAPRYYGPPNVASRSLFTAVCGDRCPPGQIPRRCLSV